MKLTLQKQAYRHDPANGIDGDCTRTCVAMLLGLPRDSVPHAHGAYTPSDYLAWKEAIGRQFGVLFITIPLPPQEGWGLETYCEWALGRGQNMPLMMGGLSRNGTNHSVVLTDDGRLLDPAIDDSGIVGPCTDGFYWFEWIVAPPDRVDLPFWPAAAPPNSDILSDPAAVHVNMLRGTIAKPSVENVIHLYGADVLRTALGVSWRCFHCDEVFTDQAGARDHFGRDETCEPACRIPMGGERSLLTALRRAEDAAAAACEAILSESTEAAKAYYAQHARHREQLQAVEVVGFERGVRDARAELVTALNTAVGHIEHMAAFLGGLKAGYSFESLGEDMPDIRAALGEIQP